MAVRTFRLASGTDNTAAAMSETDQTAASRTDGWTVAKLAATNSNEFIVGTKVTSGAFTLESSISKPGAGVFNVGRTFKTPTALSGIFAATAWTFTFAIRATTASAQAGRMRMRVWRSANANGSGATEITSATVVGTTSATLSTTADVTTVCTWSPGAITLNNEFLFFMLAWEVTTAGGSNSCDVLLRTGQSAAGTRVVTPDFTAVYTDAATVPIALTPSAVEVPPPLPFVDTLKDTFDTQIDSTVWKNLTGSTLPVWDASGAAKLSTPTGGGTSNLATGAGSVYAYNMTGKEVFAKIGLPADWTTRSGDGGHSLTFLISSPPGQVSIQTQLAATPPGIIFDAGGAFNIAMSINYLWWKISESGGVITYWTSPDGINWTSRGSHSPVFDPTNVRIAFNSIGTATGFPTNIFIDNVNVSPVFKSLVAAPRSNPYRQLTRWHS